MKPLIKIETVNTKAKLASPFLKLNQMSEISKRRTFAIISHPDAGKTTVTEKLLLYGGAIKTAGSVKPEKQTLMPPVTGWKWRKREVFL